MTISCRIFCPFAGLACTSTSYRAIPRVRSPIGLVAPAEAGPVGGRPAPSMGCLCCVRHVGRGLPVLRAPGGTVDLDRHPAGGGPRFDQLERQVLAGVGEQPRALADDHGVGEQGDLVYQVVVEQPPDQAEAADHLQLAPRLGLQLADGALGPRPSSRTPAYLVCASAAHTASSSVRLSATKASGSPTVGVICAFMDTVAERRPLGLEAMNWV